MPELQHVTADTSLETISEILDRDAGLIIDNVIPKKTISSLRSQLKPYLDQALEGKDEFSGFKTRRIGALIPRSSVCQELAMNDQVNKLCSEFLLPFCDNYQLHFTQAISIGPNEKEQILHRDRGVWGGYIPRKIETQLSTVWAVDDFTEKNGATRLVPGSHKWNKDREPLEEEITCAEMKAGSVFIYTGSVLHGGGWNQTDQNRLGVFIHYTLGWLRQEENQYLSCPPEVAEDLDPELRALMGYSKGGYVLGFFSSPELGSAGLELASPERLFGIETGGFDQIKVKPEDLVKNSSNKKKLV
jgi:hypothetical protein